MLTDQHAQDADKEKKLRDLALLGGTPAFSEILHVGRPNLGDRAVLMNYIDSVFKTRWLSNRGPLLREFESRLTEFLGVKHCFTVNNATIGLEIAIRALGLSGEVIVPSFTFIASAHALQWLGITPVFCDIDPTTHTLDPHQVEALITPRTTAILGVHLWGRPCDVDALQAIAERHQLKLFYDAAHAFGCTANGQMIGNFGDLEVFSFHATKFFNTFEGGAIATNNDLLAERIQLMRNFGFTGYDQVADVGTNGKMSEASAAMGLTNFKSLDDFVSVNRRNYFKYKVELESIPGIRLIQYDEREKLNFQYIVAEINAESLGISRDILLAVLHAENVLARRYFWPGCHRMEPYQTLFPDAATHLPHTEAVAGRVLVLPSGTSISEREIELIAAIIRSAAAHASELSSLPPNNL